MGRAIKDYRGRTFGRLTAIEVSRRPGNNVMWLCVCACGNLTEVSSSNPKVGNVRSCGCLRTEIQTTHGHTRNHQSTPEYRAWSDMIQRCTNPNDKCWKDYGGRGIKVCKRWLHSFGNFLTDMGRRPTPQHSLDRWPNNDGNYEPGNCRWATRSQQANNRRVRSTSTTGISGVYKRSDCDKFVATISSEGKRIYLGSFGSIEEAHAAQLSFNGGM